MAKDNFFNLPDKPVDRYRVDWYETSDNRIMHCHAIYYINSPYTAHDPESDWGAPITDEWMVFESESCTGRCDGWLTINKHEYRNIYRTIEEAELAILEYLNEYLPRKQQEVNDMVDTAKIYYKKLSAEQKQLFPNLYGLDFIKISL